MNIRHAVETDLSIIMDLGKEFGHQMLYQKDAELMLRYISVDRVLVAETTEVGGFYHYIVSGDNGFAEMLRCYRQMPERIIDQAMTYPRGHLCVVMQGGCHRDAFKALISFLQSQYYFLWCYNSVTDTSKPSSKIAGYEALGFVYDPRERFSFFNIHKGDYSTYQLGRWERK